MKYNLDANGYIANCATVGDVADGITYTGELPEGFWDCPQAYRIIDGALVRDADRYAELTAPAPESVDPTAALSQRIAELEAVIDALVGGEPV